jgi:dUTPase
MKTLEEKKLLVKMARAFGQPIEQELIESIEKEEQLSKIMFGEEVQPIVEQTTNDQPELLKEADPPPMPNAGLLLQKLAQVKTMPAIVPPPEPVDVPISVPPPAPEPPKVPSMVEKLQKDELDALKKTLNQVINKINTLSWGGGGTGAVRIIDQDDLDKSTVANGRYMKYQDGWFVMDEINPFEIIHNTTLVTTNTYTVVDSDYYIGVNYAGPVTITIPADISSGREVVIKDESGNCETHNITVSARVDNDANGFILAVNNGAIHMLYRDDSWRII